MTTRDPSQLPRWLPFRRYFGELTDGLDQHFFVAAFVAVGVIFLTLTLRAFGTGQSALSAIAQDVQSLTLATAYWWGFLYFVTGRRRDTLAELRKDNPIAFAVVVAGILLFCGQTLHR